MTLVHLADGLMTAGCAEWCRRQGYHFVGMAQRKYHTSYPSFRYEHIGARRRVFLDSVYDEPGEWLSLVMTDERARKGGG